MIRYQLEVGHIYSFDHKTQPPFCLFESEKRAKINREFFRKTYNNNLIDKLFTVVSNIPLYEKITQKSIVGILIENEILYFIMDNDRSVLRKLNIREICDDDYLGFLFKND